MKVIIRQMRFPTKNEDLNVEQDLITKDGKTVHIPPTIMVLNEDGERIGVIKENIGLSLSLGYCYIALELGNNISEESLPNKQIQLRRLAENKRLIKVLRQIKEILDNVEFPENTALDEIDKLLNEETLRSIYDATRRRRNNV